MALDAASRGLRTALVEKDDFASGTSSKSSKLVHGGLRYLQQREFRLVYENLAERQRLLDNAPHLVSPLPFLIPLFGRDGVVNRSVARAYRTALWLYDLTGGMRIGQRHRAGDPGPGPGPPPHPAHRPAGGRLPLLGRPDRRRPAHPGGPAHGGARPRRGGRQPRRRSPRLRHRRRAAGCTGARVAPDGGEPFDDPRLGGGQRHRRVGRRGPRPRRGPQPPLHPPGQGDPHHRARRPRSRATSPRSSRSRRTTARSSSSPGATRSTSAPPTPSGTARSTTRPASPRTSTTSSTRPTPSPPARSAGTTSPACGPGCARCSLPAKGKHALSERTADLSRRHTVRTSAGRGGHRDRRQADHLPEDGPGHRRRRGRRRWADGAPAAVTKHLRLHGARRPATTRRPGRSSAGRHLRHGRRRRGQPRPAAHLAGRYGTETPTVLALADGHPELLEPLVPGPPLPGGRGRLRGAPRDGPVAGRRPRPADPGRRCATPAAAADAARRVAALIAPDLGWDGRPQAQPRRRPTPQQSERCWPGPGSVPTRFRPTSSQRPTAVPQGGPTSREEPRDRADAGHAHRRAPRASVGDRLGGAAGRRRRLPPAPPGRRVRRGHATTTRHRAEAGRDWWPLAIGWAAPGTGPGPARRRRPAHRHRPGGRGARRSATTPGSRSPPSAGRSGVCGVVHPALRRRRPRPLRPGRHRRRRHRRRWWPTCGPAPSVPTSRPGCATTTDVTLGHWPQSMDLSTVGGWLACRGAGQYSNRYGKIEDMVIGLEVVLADGRVVRTGGHGTPFGHRSRPHPAVRGQRGHPRGHHRGAVPGPPGARQAEGRRAFGFASFADGLDACRRILRRGRHAGRAPPLRRDRVGPVLRPARHQRAHRPRRGRPRPGRRHPGRGRRGVRAAPTPLDVGLVERWLGAPQRRLGPRPAVAGRHRRRHRRDRRPGGRRCPASTARCSTPSDGVEGTLAASSHQSPRLHRRRLPLLHLRRPAADGATGAGRRGRRGRTRRRTWAEPATTDAAWDAVTAGHHGDAGGAISHHHGIGLNRARFLPDALGPAFDVLATVKEALDPNGILNPGKLGLPPARSAPVALAVSILVVDIGTSGVRGAVVAARRHGRARPPRAGAARHPVPRAGRVRRHRHGRRRARGGRAEPGRRAARSTAVGIANQRASTIVWDRATGKPVGPGHRLAGPAHRRHLPRAPGRGHPGGPQRLGHQAGRAPRPGRPGPVAVRARRAVPSARSTPGWPGRCRAARSTSPTPPTPASPA